MDAGYDVFVSYAHADAEPVLALRDALEARGLTVWLDDSTIETFESISGAIERGLAHSKAVVAYYSQTYPGRRACQWELTAAYLAAAQLGDPRRRVLVVNPHPTVAHIEPVQLRDALLAAGGDISAAADALAAHVASVEGELGDRGMFVTPPWFGQRPLGSARFVGRSVDMWKLHSALHAGNVSLITGARGQALAVLTGMGGIGKSLLVEEYAMRFGAAYPGGVFWLRAFGHDDSSQPLAAEGRVAQRDAQLLKFAGDLGLVTTDLAPDQLPAALGVALDERALAFLWIVDDLPGELTRDEINDWLAPGRYGETLVTTRSRGYDPVGCQIELGVLSSAEGVALLALHRKPEGAKETAAAQDLVADLGGHALALDVAGAALKAETGMVSFAEYRDALMSPSDDELEFSTRYAGALPSGHEPSIASTLRRSIARLGDAGLDFLRLAAQLAVQPIPAGLVVEVLAAADALDPRSARRRAAGGMHDAETLSLAETAGQDDGSRRVHTLVSRTIRLLERDAERSAALAAAATRALTATLSAFDSAGTIAPDATLAHARHIAAPAADALQAALLYWVGDQDSTRGDYRSARALLRQVVDAQAAFLGPEHPDTLKSTAGLAAVLRQSGDLTGSRALCELVVEAQTRVLGEEHEDTLRSLNSLAATLRECGDFEAARELHERALQTQRRVLGEAHWETILTMNSLAVTLAELAQLDDACELLQRVVDGMGRVVGEQHPDYLNCMSNLAAAQGMAGDMEGACRMLERIVRTQRRLQGEEHPTTLGSTYNLAAMLDELGDPEAGPLLVRVSDAQRRVLGDEHPQTLISIDRLAGSLRKHGDLEGARALGAEVLAARRRVLSDTHPDTRSAMNGLADTLSALGDGAGAQALWAEGRGV